jgi:hypothetical protein
MTDYVRLSVNISSATAAFFEKHKSRGTSATDMVQRMTELHTLVENEIGCGGSVLVRRANGDVYELTFLGGL